MKSKLQNGYSNGVGLIILAIIILIILSAPRNSSSNLTSPTLSSGGGNFLDSFKAPGRFLAEGSPVTSSGAGGNSAYASNISVGVGNAPYESQSENEYITIGNSGASPIDITGWQLRNGKDQQAYYLNGALQRFSADTASIPQGASLLSPIGYSPLQDVILKQGEMAIITTGSVGNQSPYRITSFKENMCTGYIEALPEYSFTPPLSQNCPDPERESGFNNLDNQCKEFVRSISQCHTPVFNATTPDRQGYCTTCVDGKILSSQCAAFVKEHYSYQGCIANHENAPSFFGRTWRIFLGRGWEMWNTREETINLFDRLGNLVNSQKY